MSTTKSYQQLLEREADSVCLADFEQIAALFETKADSLRRACPDAAAGLLNHATRLRLLLDKPDILTERQLLVALGALRYFVRDEDHTDDLCRNGHYDDALVLQAATWELHEPLGKLER